MDSNYATEVVGDLRSNDLQALINQYADNGAHDEARQLAEANFRAIHDQYPQYTDWLDDTELVQTIEQTRGKGGISALPGDWVLVKPADYMADNGYELAHLRIIHSVRLGWNCAIEPTALSEPVTA